MRTATIILTLFLLSSCSSTKLTSSWKNPEFTGFKPKKILVIGVTSNAEVRNTFERALKNELNKRQINALKSNVVFEKSFNDSTYTQQEIESQLNTLTKAGYDTVLVSLVKDINNNTFYNGIPPKLNYRLPKLLVLYLSYPNINTRQNYQQRKFQIFEIESSLYSLCAESGKTLVWSGNYHIIDPKNTQRTIVNYVKKVLKSLEKEALISKKGM
ncbi:MAG: hypothetical protein ED556_00780 [Winogradskyella sp.]|uniref:hypothetical protein n=1 Tax=Winogradskyella sp. TaxID=1883156 RepID=UPI000F3DF342|nr:hypothetical protein [Winogradskyella sp.]RNC87756.1 MAG: hypothetical protein ED556_00780 [Winogradskyella sp.]